nr:NAD(P)H-binding protein [Kineococcus rhizosphaerae]
MRPGTLTDEEGTGRVTAGTAVAHGSVPRDDVAAFLVEALSTPGLNRARGPRSVGCRRPPGPSPDAAGGAHRRNLLHR